MDLERSSFEATWRDLADFVLPRRPRFFVQDTNKGERRSQKILNTTATMSARTLRAGMMSGVTSPARPWFRLTVSDPALSEFGPVKNYLDAVQKRISTTFLRSNLYQVLPIIYGDLGVFGNACVYVEEDFDGSVMRFYPFPIGSYKIAQNAKLKVDTFEREFMMTVRQIVHKFAKMEDGKIDWSNISTHVKDQYEQGHLETQIEIRHVIMPNEDWDIRRAESRFKKFVSIYYETGALGTKRYFDDTDLDRYLSIKGYDYFPIFAPRWETTGEDTYATDCPALVALGDIKQLQLGERRIMQAVEKHINPPMVGPTSLRNQRASILPGDITYDDQAANKGGFRQAHDINFAVNQLENKQSQVEARIQRAFFEDLFLMLAQSDRRQITAREIEERHEEKLLALGPVLEQLNQDMLDPLIDIAFDFHARQGLLPEPPPELEGQDLKVEYISVMAQAQKLVGISSVDRFTGFVGNLAAYDPTVLKKVDTSQLVDVYGDMLSISPKVIRPDEQVQELVAAEQRAQAQQQQIAMAKEAAGAAKDLSAARLDEENMLDQIMGG